MLVNGLYDNMYVIFVNVKLLTYFENDISVMVNLCEPTTMCEGDIFDALFEAQLPLIALVEAGPNILESLAIPDSAQKKWGLASDRRFLEHTVSAVGESAFTLSKDEIARIRAIVVDENHYDSKLFDSIIDLAAMAAEFCLECEYLFHSSFSTEDVSMPLIFSYFEKAKTSANRNFLEHFPC